MIYIYMPYSRHLANTKLELLIIIVIMNEIFLYILHTFITI